MILHRPRWSRSFSLVAMGAVVLLLATNAIGNQPSASSITVQEEFIYRNIWHEFEVKMSERRWSFGPTVGSREYRVGVENGLTEAGLMGESMACSTSEFHCIKGFFRVLAVPRRGLSAKQEYSVAGAKFSVAECQHIENGVCGLAMVIGECWMQAEAPWDYCVEPKSGTEKPGYIYFLYSRSVGITAMGGGLAPDKLPSRADKLAVTTQEILVSPYGLLRLAPEYR